MPSRDRIRDTHGKIFRVHQVLLHMRGKCLSQAWSITRKTSNASGLSILEILSHRSIWFRFTDRTWKDSTLSNPTSNDWTSNNPTLNDLTSNMIQRMENTTHCERENLERLNLEYIPISQKDQFKTFKTTFWYNLNIPLSNKNIHYFTVSCYVIIIVSLSNVQMRSNIWFTIFNINIYWAVNL
jgi:hypothetical protein